MSNRIIIILLCVAAAAFGVVLWATLEISASSRSERDALESRLSRLERKAGMQPSGSTEIEFPAGDDREEAVMRRLARQNKRMEKIEEDMAALNRRLNSGGTAAGNESSTDSDMKALLASVERGGGEAAEVPFTPEQLKTVRKLLDQLREEDKARRIKNFANNVKLRMRDDYMKWKEDLRLTPEQESEVDEFIDETLQRAVTAWDEYLENGDIESLRKELREVRKSVDGKAYDVLDAWQVDKLKELDPRGFGARNKDR
ncbi:MAG: hypothetical protein ACYS8W_19465 [Planctomycetota bacterium]|jgi:Lon protease-like protein